MSCFRLTALLLTSCVALFLAGCGDGHDHAGGTHPAGGHAHEAKYGGTLIEVGEHQFNVELVHDAVAGKLTAYLLDAHAENFVRVAFETLPVTVTLGAAPQTVTLRAVGNTATGEKPGDTSQFEGTADWLKGVAKIEGVIPELTLKGRTFTQLKFKLAK